MSLVDYSSDEGDEALVEEGKEECGSDKATVEHKSIPQPNPQPLNEMLVMPAQLSSSSCNKPAPEILRLPDVSLLLDSPTLPLNMASVYDHSSRVSAAMAQNASRKRESNDLPSTQPHAKFSRGALPHVRNIPETASGLLRPPQLSGRSNIVTEDISKLFVKRNDPPTSVRSPSQ